MVVLLVKYSNLHEACTMRPNRLLLTSVLKHCSAFSAGFLTGFLYQLLKLQSFYLACTVGTFSTQNMKLLCTSYVEKTKNQHNTDAFYNPCCDKLDKYANSMLD